MITTSVLIIGTGFSGLGMAIKLRESGREDFIILEKASQIGGTWRDNTYPGCECDIQSHMYSFSYELNNSWTHDYSGQAEIWQYLIDVTERHQLAEKIHFGVEMTSARFNERDYYWEVETRDGQNYRAQFLISGMGGLHIPHTPDFPGAENFVGPFFHSAAWDHSVDLSDKRVAVIGTGASAVQFIPKIAPQVRQLDIYQRTPGWIIEKNNQPITGLKRRILTSIPGAARLYRNLLYWMIESTQIGFTGPLQPITRLIEKKSIRSIRETVRDPQTAEKLIPNFRLGCKRVLKTNDYLPVFNRANVSLITDAIVTIEDQGIRSATESRPADVIIYATGFHVTDAFKFITITGRGGTSISERFDEQGIETYLGITVTGFPNFFMMLGPNTALGHNSVVFMIEQQTKWIIKMIAELEARSAAAVEPTLEAQQSFNERLQRKVSKGVWSQGGCRSWYLDSQGKNRTIWPGFTFRYWSATRRINPRHFSFSAPNISGEPASGRGAELVS